MEKRKHKRLNDTIMKPEDLKKSRVIPSGPSTSATSGGIKAKLDFRTPTGIPPKPALNSTANHPSVQSSQLVRPHLDDKWKEFGDSIVLNLETFEKSVDDAILAGNFNKVARMFVAALKSFLEGDKLKIELRLMGTIGLTVKTHGDKLNHVPLHRGLLFLLSHSKSYPENILELLLSTITSLAKQQQILDKCYINAFLYDAIGMNVGLGTVNKCSWIEKESSKELVQRILEPFATCYPSMDMYPPTGIENFTMADWLRGFGERFGRRNTENGPRSDAQNTQLEVFLEFLKPWFETIRGEVLPKPLFRALCLLCGSENVRQFISSRLEIWITLQKFHREISELLLVLGTNINVKQYEMDREMIDVLLKLNTKNMKTRTVVGPFNVCLRRICDLPANVEIVLESLVVNETGPPQNRSNNNLQTIYMILNSHTEEATKALARITSRELIKEKENSVKMLRAFFREMIRGFYQQKTGEFPFAAFAETVFKEVLRRGEADEVPLLMCDMVSQMPLITLTAVITTRENAFSTKYNTPLPTGDYPMISTEAKIAKEKFKAEYVAFAENCIEFLISSRKLFQTDGTYLASFYLLLFLESNRDVYPGIEMAVVTEAEMTTCVRVFGECGLSEKMFLMLCHEGTNQLSPRSLIDLISALTHRAVTHQSQTSTVPLISFSDPFELIDSFLQMTIYPESDLPRLDPPICQRNLYWIAWNIIILWIAGGSEICGKFAKIYESYTVLRYMIHCIMTRKFEFPRDFEGKSAGIMAEEEAAMESSEAIVLNMYRKKLDRGMPVEAMAFLERSAFRAPSLMDEIRHLSDRYQLASRFAKCQSPPLLSQLIQTVGAQNSLFAIREMLSVDASTAKRLTSECIFHSLIYYFDSHRLRDLDQNSSHVVKALILQAEKNLKSAESVDEDFLLQSFVSSLASPQFSIRSAAVNTFSKLFPPSDEDKPFDLGKLSLVPRFDSRKSTYLETMASAILVETDAHLANSYLHFLTKNSMENEDDHRIARAICQILSTDCQQLHTSLCDYFVQYVDMCSEIHKIKESTPIDDSLCCLDIGTSRIALSREVPVAVVKLLSKFDTKNMEKGGKSTPFEMLVQFWLSPGRIPKMVDRQTGETRQFLNLPMRKEMLKSAEQRVVDAALEDLSETDAQEFVLVSQMSRETAEKVFRKAENMKIQSLDRQTLSNMYLLLRGYRMTGVKSGELLLNRIKEEMDRLDSIVLKEEPMEIQMPENETKPEGFLRLAMLCTAEKSLVFTSGTMEKMEANDISNWLKTHCAALTNPAKSKSAPIFRVPSAFIQSAMNDEKCSLSCLSHIEANLKFFLSHESAFQTLSVIIDSAANKFDFVRKRLETFSAKILKSVTPPPSVIGILQKHAANSQKSSQTTPKNHKIAASTFSEFAGALKKVSSDQKDEKRLIGEFMTTFVKDKGEVVDSEDVYVFIRSLLKVYAGENSESTVEKCLSNRWSPQLRAIVCSVVLEKYSPGICAVFVFRLLSAYCKKYPVASFNELFMIRKGEEGLVLNTNAINVCVFYFCDVATDTDDYDTQIVSLISALETQGGTRIGYLFARALLQTCCANASPIRRRTAQRLLELLSDSLLYLQYKVGMVSSLRVLSNIESRDSCIRRCEQIVDRIVEMALDPSAQLSEDICEEEREKLQDPKELEKEKEAAAAANESKFKRGFDKRGGGGPLAKKGRFITPKDLPGPLGATTTKAADDGEDSNSNDEPIVVAKREWIETSHAITRFNSLLREHPNIVKMKFPVLANYVSRLSAMSRKDLKEEKRINKVELVLQSVVTLCQYMKPDEINSVDTALSNCLEFFEKHLEEGGYGVKEQTAFAELTIKACAEYLNHSFLEARSFLRDNRTLVERVCKRCHDRYNVEMVLDNCQPISF
ncbi:hypothetical protein L3Y34_014182 [Caenorhabditis briggsae]|uniref:Integrator complex subunit 1 RPB2-binding domain-containing protein n=1 Tax=Caenorhabditis briggsae TaxID=6238 RepID=A0AAE9DSZ8_CAEBR|nr:hypothetical protein L3Y34_014182 [Caenorhabditis briggsae]